MVPAYIGWLPPLNAALNASAALLLTAGWLAVRSGRRELHRALMVCAFLCSAAFLASYLLYHYHAGSVNYQGPGRPLYLAILLSHTILAVLVPPAALRTLWLGWRAWPGGDFSRHARLARIGLPIWLYVSATGVVIYWMLYVWPGGAGSTHQITVTLG